MNGIQPSLEHFVALSKQGNTVPVFLELLADLETPVSVFRKLDAASDHAFLLESVEQGETLGRYSFLGADPAVVFRVQHGEQTIESADPTLRPAANPIETLRALLSRYRAVPNPALPPFFGGAVGYMAYDTVRYYERIPDTRPDELELPDCLILVAETMIVFDHVRHRMTLVVNARTDGGGSLEDVYTEAGRRLAALKARVLAPPPPAPAPPRPRQGEPAGLAEFRDLGITVESNCDKAFYLEMLRRAKEYITAGDIFQVVLSQRFSTEISCAPFDVYRALRAVNPSPYMFYLKCGPGFQLAGSSPEILSKLEDGRVTVRPIAGTRRRGLTPEEDLALEKDLLADEKELAEHVMLVDLGRNDVGRVSRYGTVKVRDFKTIERYSHVMHIVSSVTGELVDGKDGFDVLAATFPAGTLSGAPKIRAMEIIDELEKSRRGPYGGSVVYFSLDGSMDSCITIRTAVIKGSQVFVQAGGGIVADSDPELEFAETVNKAKGMLKAVAMAEGGLE